MLQIKHLLPAAMLLLASCASHRSAYQLSGEWNVVNLNGTEIVPSKQTPYLGFDINENLIYGFTGCNRLTVRLDAAQFLKGKAEIGTLGMTRMLCQDDQYETPFMECLGKVAASEIKDNMMFLKDKDGKTLITLKKK